MTPLAMVLYGIALLPLAEILREAYPEVLQHPQHREEQALDAVDGAAPVPETRHVRF